MKLYVAGWDPSGPLKIGTSDNPESRLKIIRAGCPYHLRVLAEGSRPQGSGTAWSAQALCVWTHRKLQERRLRGEWYDTSLADVQRLLADSVRWRMPD